MISHKLPRDLSFKIKNTCKNPIRLTEIRQEPADITVRLRTKQERSPTRPT